MADDGWLLAKKAQLLELECRMQSMIADNKFREYIGSEPMHTGYDFSIICGEIQSIQQEIMENR